MIITLGQARKAVGQYAGRGGKCPESEDVRLFIHEVVQRLLHRGAHGALKKWTFCACNGCFTAPSDMELPLKVKINGYPEAVWSKWYEFADAHEVDICDTSYRPGLYEEVNSYFTVYDMPASGGYVVAVPLESEEGKYITVQGLDLNGREVFSSVNGRQIHGERLPINRETPIFSKNQFSKITGIEKDRTCNYVRLYWQTYNLEVEQVTGRGLLAEYRPNETHPSFKRFRVPNLENDCAKITVIGRIKDIEYFHDNDVLPVTSLSALKKIAQLIQAEGNNDIQTATFHENTVDNLIENENQYLRTGQDPFDFFIPTSPGMNENLQ